MQACLESYNEITGEEPSKITYDCVGSGSGKRKLLSGAATMAGTDSLFDDESYLQKPDLQMIPVVAAPIAITFNIGDYKSLILDRETVGKIFIGNITRWSDPQISRINPSKYLPDEPIRVVVRDDSSGTTEIMVKALASFGYWKGQVTNTWPHKATIERRSKSSGVLKYVSETPFSIGYSGISGVLQEGLPFATVANRAEALTIPGWSDGETATTGLSLEPNRLTGDLVDEVGYPIAGISYLAFFTTPGNETCEIVSFIVWMLTSSVSRAIINANNLVPLDNKIINEVLDKLSINCGTQRLSTPIPLYTGDQQEFKGIANELGYKYYQENIRDYVQVSAAEEANVMLRSESDSLPEDVENEYIKIRFAAGMLTIACNFGIPVPSMELDVEVISDIFAGKLKYWNDSRLSARSTYVPKQNIPIQIIAHKSLVLYKRLVGQLSKRFEFSLNSSNSPDVVFDSNADVLQHVKDTIGSIAVVDYTLATQWNLQLMYPVVNSVPYVPSLTVLSQIPNTEDDYSLYPFIYRVFFYVKKRVTGVECSNAHAFLAQWLVTPDKTTDSLKKHLMFPITENGTNGKLSELMCNDQFIFPKQESSASNNLVWILVGVIGGVTVVVAAGLFGGFAWKWRHQRLRYESAFGAQVLAAEMAEAVAVLDFNSLEKVFTIENPDRIQLAIKDITIMMKEFVKYIPQSVVKAVRNESEDDSDEATATIDTNQINTTEFTTVDHNKDRQPSKTGSTDITSRAASGLGKKLDHAVRCVSVLVIRRIFAHQSETRSPPEKEPEKMQTDFLSVCLHEIELMHGTVHRITEDAIIGSWGSMTEQRRHPDFKKICQVAIIITQKCTYANCGVNSGLAHCGSLGNDKIRTFHIMGGIIEEADNLCRVAQAAKARCLLPYGRCLDLWGHTFKFARFFSVASVFGGKPTEVAALLGEALVRLNSKEWMYELEDRELQPEPGPEKAMHVLLNSNSFEEALLTLSSYTNTVNCDEASPFTKWLESTLSTFRTLYPEGTLPGIPVFEVTCVGTIFTSVGELVSRPSEGLLQPCDYVTPNTSHFHATPRSRLLPTPLLSPPQVTRSPPPASAHRLHRPDFLR